MKLVWKVLIVLCVFVLTIIAICLILFRKPIFGGYIKQPFKNVWEDHNKKGERYKDVLLKMLSDMNSVFKKHDIKYIYTFGNLLGIMRHEEGLIPYDDDVDIAVSEEDYHKIKHLVGEFKELGIGVDTQNFLFMQVVKLYDLSEKPIFPFVWKFSWPFIDVFYYK